MNWWIAVKKTLKHATISGGAAAIAYAQAVPPGTPIDWKQLCITVCVAAITGGGAGGALNVVKHTRPQPGP